MVSSTSGSGSTLTSLSRYSNMLHCSVSHLFPWQSFLMKDEIVTGESYPFWKDGGLPFCWSYRILYDGVDLKTFIHV